MFQVWYRKDNVKYFAGNYDTEDEATMAAENIVKKENVPANVTIGNSVLVKRVS